VAVRVFESERRALRARVVARGIDAERKLVTLHVREPAYKAALGIADRWKDHVRNARIDSYFEAIDWLVAQGYLVVRIGDPQMTPVRRAGVIDLATSEPRDAQLELWCVLHSRFFISTDCGPYNLAVLGNVPCLATNMSHVIGGYPLRRHDMYLLKRVVDVKTGRELDLSELLEPGRLKHRWDPEQFAFCDNTAAEILDGVPDPRLAPYRPARFLS